MIRILGIRRIVILAVLIGLNLIFTWFVYVVLTPEKLRKEREMAQLRSQMAVLQTDIEAVQVELEQIRNQQAAFSTLKEKGFFGSQNRRQAEKTLEKIQREAGVISAVASIRAGAVEDNEEAAKAEYKILRSPVVVSVDSLDDVDVFRYLYLVENYFPGHVALTGLDLKREADVSGVVLRGIASGENPPLVKAEITLMWRTMIPKPKVIGAPEESKEF